MLSKLLKRVSVLVVSAFVFVGVLPSVYAAGDDKSHAETVCASLKDYERTAISDLAKHLGLEESVLKAVLVFKASERSKFFETNCCLIPLCDCDEHLNCFLNLFSYANPDYMKYYLNGELMATDRVKTWFKRSVGNIGVDSPNSVTFLIKVGDKVVGRVGIGPLANRGKIEAEIGYAIKEPYSGQGIMGKAVDSALCFLKLLREKGKECYDFTRLRATAKIANGPSNGILCTRGFVLSDKLIDDGYGPEKEYFYYFV